jgi:hypothetical protein
MSVNYLDAARKGRNKWGQYVLNLIVIPFATIFCVYSVLILGLLLLGQVSHADLKDPAFLSTFLKSQPLWIAYILFISSYSFVIVSILIGIERNHHRNFISVICPEQNFNVKRCFNAFIVWFAMSLLLNAGAAYIYMVDPQSFKLVINPSQWLMYLVPAIIYAFVYALSTEIMRGYVLQGMGLIIRQQFLLIFISGFLSTMSSIPSSLKQSPYIQPQYIIINFIFSVGLALFILKGNNLELVLGIQTAGNFASRFISYQPAEGTMVLPTIFSISRDTQFLAIAASIAVVALCIKIAIFYAVFLRKSLPLAENTD